MTTMAKSKSSAMSKEVKLVKVINPFKETDEKPVITSKKFSRTSSARYVVKRSVDVLQGRGVTNKAVQAALFVGKVVVLEALRRVGHTNLYGLHRPLLWTLQGLSGLNCLTLLQAPPLVWLQQRWAPFRFLAHATEVTFFFHLVHSVCIIKSCPCIILVQLISVFSRLIEIELCLEMASCDHSGKLLP